MNESNPDESTVCDVAIQVAKFQTPTYSFQRGIDYVTYSVGTTHLWNVSGFKDE